MVAVATPAAGGGKPSTAGSAAQRTDTERRYAFDRKRKAVVAATRARACVCARVSVFAESDTLLLADVFGEETAQTEVFALSGAEALISSAIEGYASTIIAYGQTGTRRRARSRSESALSARACVFEGSGKTYTMSGLEERILSDGFQSPDTNGLIPRGLARLFEVVSARTSPHTQFKVCVLLRRRRAASRSTRVAADPRVLPRGVQRAGG